MAVFYSLTQSVLETPIKVMENGYCFENISADVQVSVAEVDYILQTPCLIGLHT